MGILRITMMKMSSQRVSGPFTALECTRGHGLEPERVIEPERAAIPVP
jgi:hypothetical protein